MNKNITIGRGIWKRWKELGRRLAEKLNFAIMTEIVEILIQRADWRKECVADEKCPWLLGLQRPNFGIPNASAENTVYL